MASDFDNKKYFHSLLEKACKGTPIISKELLRELITSGYKNIYDSDLSVDDLKMIVADLIDSKEISEQHSQRSGKKNTVVEIDNEDDDEIVEEAS